MIGEAWYEWLAYLVLCCTLVVFFMTGPKARLFLHGMLIIPSTVLVLVLASEVAFKGVYKFLFVTPLIWCFIAMSLSGVYYVLFYRFR